MVKAFVSVRVPAHGYFLEAVMYLCKLHSVKLCSCWTRTNGRAVSPYPTPTQVLKASCPHQEAVSSPS